MFVLRFVEVHVGNVEVYGLNMKLYRQRDLPIT